MNTTKLLSLEAKTYELLGVKTFRVLVFKLEKIIHRKDHGTNINYHIGSYEPSSIDAFMKYLFYNGSIHVRNLVYFAVYLAIHWLLAWQFHWYDIVVALLAIKDAYCVMLQRYNYIRIQARKTRLDQKRAAKIQRKVSLAKDEFLERYDRQFAQNDLQIISDMKRKIASGESIIIGNNERETLERLAFILGKKQNNE